MAEESFSLDSLLEDLDAAVVHTPSAQAQTGGTVRFVPHPPPKNVSQTSVHNPKNRFAVQPAPGSTSPDGLATHSFGASANANANNSPNYKSYTSASVQPSSNARDTPDPDENSIDNLLNLMNSPQQPSRPSQPNTSQIKPTSPIGDHSTSLYQGFDNPRAYTGGFGQNMSKPATVFNAADNRAMQHHSSNNNHNHYNNHSNYHQHNNHHNYHNNNNHSGGSNNNHHQHSHHGGENLSSHNHNNYGGTTLETSDFSSPFDSPSSHGSASTGAFSATRKTHPAGNGILSSHSDSSYSSDPRAANNGTGNSTGNSNSKDRSAAPVFPSATFTPPGSSGGGSSGGGGDSGQKRHTGNNLNNNASSGSLLQPIGSDNKDCATTTFNSYSNGNGNGSKTRSGAGVSGGLFGKTDTAASNKSNLQDIMSSSAQTSTSSSSSSTSSGANKGSTVTFTSQQKQGGNTHFLPASINATTVVSSSSQLHGNSGGAGGGGGGGMAFSSINVPATTAAGSSGASKARCTRVIIAGSAMERGRKSSAFAQLACNNLRCIQCNFKVHCFANSEWDGTVDYMFLRNTVPNEVKLAQKLTRSAESCAYCCQCSHTSENGERELTAQAGNGEPQWVCAGH